MLPELNSKNHEFRKRIIFRRRLFTSSLKSKIRQFHVVLVQKEKEMYKKVRCTCKVVVLPTKPIVVFDVLVAVAS